MTDNNININEIFDAAMQDPSLLSTIDTKPPLLSILKNCIDFPSFVRHNLVQLSHILFGYLCVVYLNLLQMGQFE